MSVLYDTEVNGIKKRLLQQTLVMNDDDVSDVTLFAEMRRTRRR